MNRAAEINAHMAAQAALYQARPAHKALDDLRVGTASLAALVERWGPMLPKPGDLAGAVATLEGLRRVVSEIGQHVACDEGVRVDGTF